MGQYLRLALAIMLAVFVAVAAYSIWGDDAETDGDETALPLADDSATTASSTTVPSTTTTTEPPPPVVEDLSGIRWVVNDFDGLVDDQGRTLMTLTGPGSGSGRTVARAPDGSLYFLMDEELWQWAPDQSEPVPVKVETDEMFELGYDGDGNIVINPTGDPEVVADGIGGRQRPASQILGETGDFITAPNGLTVRVLEPDTDVDEIGYVTDFRGPARLQVERANGSVEWTIDAGGIDAPWLTLIDFDGRFVMMARYPTEPADPALQHIVYDLNCQSESIAGQGCTTTFWARYGKAALAGPDLDSGDNQLNVQLLDICPTMRTEIPPPAEMTESDILEASFGPAGIDVFERAVWGLATCDPLTLRLFDTEGLDYEPGTEADGWLWTEFARALDGPVSVDGDGGLTWNRHPDRAVVELQTDSGLPFMEFVPPSSRPAGQLAVTVGEETIVVSGHAEESVAADILQAANDLADDRQLEVVEFLQIEGLAPPASELDALIDAVADTFGGNSLIGEIHLTDDGLVTTTVDSSRPSAADETLGFTFADFASGGESAVDDLRFAERVGLAIGSDVQAWRESSVLIHRSAWTVNIAYFQDFEGPFNILDAVPSPSAFAVGPHLRCAGPLPNPAPPELAQYRRIGILPAEGSISSCLAWSAVDLFVDEDGVIHGVSFDVFGP